MIKSRNQPWLLPDSGTADPCRGRTSTSKRPRNCPGMSWEVLLHCSLSKDCTPLHHLWLERCTDMLGINMKELLYNNAQQHTKHCIVFWSLLLLSRVVQAAHLLWAGSCWMFGRGLLQCLSSADIIQHPVSSVRFWASKRVHVDSMLSPCFLQFGWSQDEVVARIREWPQNLRGFLSLPKPPTKRGCRSREDVVVPVPTGFEWTTEADNVDDRHLLLFYAASPSLGCGWRIWTP